MWQEHWQTIKDYFRLVGRLAIKKNIFFNASAITFNLFLCAIPFTLILVSILGYVLSIDAAFDEVMRYGRELFPAFSYETQDGDIIAGSITLESLVMPLVEARRLFGIIGMIILMFFAQGLFHTMKHVLFEVFDIEDRRHPIMEFVYNFFAFGVIGGVFLFFTMAISLISLYPISAFSVPFTDVEIRLGWITELLAWLIPIIFTPLLFYAIYRYISEKRISRKVAFLSALVYTFLFELAKSGVGVYLEYAFTTYQYYYQGYTVLIIIVIWTFYAAALFVITSVMARAYQDLFEDTQNQIEQNTETQFT